MNRNAPETDDCTHESSTGIDQCEGPDKVWRCDGCGWLHRFELHSTSVYRVVAANVSREEPT